MMLQPREARICGNERVLVSTAEVKKGDCLEVRPGEKIPLDGTVREGVSEVDESLVTGESKPVEKSSGSEVIGGSMNGLGAIVVEVTRIGGETVLAQIARLVENAQAAPRRSKSSRGVSMYFIPLVITAAWAPCWSRQAGDATPV
jgi:P-type E1-E2 ATPase